MRKQFIIILAVILVAFLFPAGFTLLSDGEVPTPPSTHLEESAHPVLVQAENQLQDVPDSEEVVLSTGINTNLREEPADVIGIIAEAVPEDDPKPAVEDKPAADTGKAKQISSAASEKPYADPPAKETPVAKKQDEELVIQSDPVDTGIAENKDAHRPATESNTESDDQADPEPEKKPDIDAEKAEPAEETPDEADKPAPHSHSYVSKTKAPTCTEDGVEVFTCSCGAYYEEAIPALGHQWEISATYEVVDKESYCKFKSAVLTCTSPICFEGDTPLTVFYAKDYDYSYEKLYAAYKEHAEQHLANGQQASFNAKTVWDEASASMYEQLLAEQNRSPHAVISLELIPAVTHIKTEQRCSRCGTEQ